MSSETSSEILEEKPALLATEPAEDEEQHRGTVVKPSEAKLTLYHWTQSFNSQKVSVIRIQHHPLTDSSSPAKINLQLQLHETVTSLSLLPLRRRVIVRIMTTVDADWRVVHYF